MDSPTEPELFYKYAPGYHWVQYQQVWRIANLILTNNTGKLCWYLTFEENGHIYNLILSENNFDNIKHERILFSW